MTDQTPDQAPEFEGKCAFAVALGGPSKAPAGKPNCTLEQDGKTYVFSGAVPRFLFKTFHLAKRAEAKAGSTG